MDTLKALWSKIPYAPLLVGLMGLRLLVGALALPVPDEAYYLIWSHHLSGGYYDHPPMIAYFIRAGTVLFGDTAFGLRFWSILSLIPLSWFVFDTAKILWDQTVAKTALLWLNGAVLLSAGAIIATPDIPSVLFWMGAVWALARLTKSQNGRFWILFAVFAASGVYSKYTNLFLGLGVIVWLLWSPNARRWWKSPYFWSAGLLFGVLMLPHITWLLANDWISVKKQFGRLEVRTFAPLGIASLLIGQALLLNPIAAVILSRALPFKKAWDEGRILLVATLCPMVIYLIFHAFHDGIKGNWPVPIHPQLIILSALAAPLWPRLKAWLMPVGLTLSVVALMIMSASFWGYTFLKPFHTSLLWQSAMPEIEKAYGASGASRLITTDYDKYGLMHFYAQGKMPSQSVFEVERYPWQKTNFKPQERVLIVTDDKETPDLPLCFDHLTLLKTLDLQAKMPPLKVYGATAKTSHCALGGPDKK